MYEIRVCQNRMIWMRPFTAIARIKKKEKKRKDKCMEYTSWRYIVQPALKTYCPLSSKIEIS